MLLTYLISNRRRYDVPSEAGSLRLVAMMVPLLAVAVFGYGFVGLSQTQDQYRWHAGANPFSEALRSGIVILDPGAEPATARAGHFLNSLRIAGWLARLYLLALLLPPVTSKMRGRGRPHPTE